MRRWGAFVALISTFALAAAPPLVIRGLIYDGPPPFRFQQDATVTVAFVSDLSRYCGRAPAGRYWGGCTYGGIIYATNPCTISGDYVRHLCHELGHAEGWSRYHEF